MVSNVATIIRRLNKAWLSIHSLLIYESLIELQYCILCRCYRMDISRLQEKGNGRLSPKPRSLPP